MSSRDYAYTIKIAELALEKIKALSLPVDPPAYELWYTYVVGRNAELNARINRSLAQSATVPFDELDRISDECLIGSRLHGGLIDGTAKVSAEVDQIIGMLSELILSTAEGRSECADASQRLATPLDGEMLRSIADTLIRSLRTIEVQQAALEKRLAVSKKELESVHQTLAEFAIEAHLDPVTGLANRRSFDKAIEQAFAGADGVHQPLSLLMIDIDHFKSFNDRFGHLMGDSVLSLVGSVLKQSIKGQDIAARYGGEEFAIILPDTALMSACAVAEQLRIKVMQRELKVRSSGQGLGAITISIGVATQRAGERSRALVERADACLYEAKRAGRNCTRWDTDDGQLHGDAA